MSLSVQFAKILRLLLASGFPDFTGLFFCFYKDAVSIVNLCGIGSYVNEWRIYISVCRLAAVIWFHVLTSGLSGSSIKNREKHLKNNQFLGSERFEPDSSGMPIRRDVQTALFE
jgi:hypothetical protein